MRQNNRIFRMILTTVAISFFFVLTTLTTESEAESIQTNGTITPVDLQVYLNENRIEWETPPHLYNHTTYISVRDFAQQTNGLLYWQPDQQKIMIRYRGRQLTHEIGSQTMQVNQRTQQMGAPSRIYNGRTFLPLRDMAAAIAAPIRYWNEQKRTTVQMDLPHQQTGGQSRSEEAGRIDRYLRQQGFIGSALVARDGQVVLAEGYGPTGYGELNSPASRFRIASISKQFTAAAILKLVEDRKLDLRDTLSKYIPGFPRGREITVHMLLSHYAGLPSDFTRQQGDTIEDTVERIKQAGFSHAPGDKYKYSNPGYVLLAYIIERVSGMTYEQYLQETFFNPFGMSETGEFSEQAPLIVKGFRKESGRYLEAPDYISQSGTGSLYSTVYDLLKWDQALHTEKIISRDSLSNIFHLDQKAHVTVGGGSGYSTILARERDHNVTIILLSNEDRVNIHSLYLGVRSHLN